MAPKTDRAAALTESVLVGVHGPLTGARSTPRVPTPFTPPWSTVHDTVAGDPVVPAAARFHSVEKVAEHVVGAVQVTAALAEPAKSGPEGTKVAAYEDDPLGMATEQVATAVPGDEPATRGTAPHPVTGVGDPPPVVNDTLPVGVAVDPG